MIWIDHNGQSRPEHADLADEVYVRFRDGYGSPTPLHVWTFMGAGNNWKAGGPADRDNEIVAYRVVR